LRDFGDQGSGKGASPIDLHKLTLCTADRGPEGQRTINAVKHLRIRTTHPVAPHRPVAPGFFPSSWCNRLISTIDQALMLWHTRNREDFKVHRT
jgi:hypothetical protein